MAEEQKYVWPVQLRENLVTEDTNDYVATVKTFTVTKTLDDILNAIVDEGTEYKKETLQGIYLRIERKIRETVCSGYPVTTDNARFAPTITGSFDSHGEVLEGSTAKCGINIQPTDKMTKELAKVKIHVDSVLEQGGAKMLRSIKKAFDMVKQEDPDTAITVHTIRMWCKEGKIKCLTAGNKILVDVQSLMDYIAIKE